MIVRAVRYETRRTLGRILDWIELHQLATRDTVDGALIVKRRRRATQFPIWIANVYLKRQRSGVEILPTEEWLRWEAAVSSATHNARAGDGSPGLQATETLRTRSDSWTVPQTPGDPLNQILSDTRWPIAEKLRSVGWALNSLGHLHACSADWGNGCPRPLSHGDATASNVLIDMSSQSARWIDFDTRHLASLASIDRQADDLRACIVSAAVHLEIVHFRPLVAQLRASYPARDVHAHLCNRQIAEWHSPSTFQLAQAPLPFARARALAASLAAE